MELSSFESLQAISSFIQTLPQFQGDVIDRLNADFTSLAVEIKQSNLSEDEFEILKLRNSLVAIINEMFKGAPLLQKLFIAFGMEFPHEYSQIRDNLEKFGFETGDTGNILIKGEIQSGKTAMMILSSMCFMACGSDVFIVCRNSRSDVSQFCRRFEDISKRLFKKFQLPRFEISDLKHRQIDELPRIFVVCFNKSNMLKLKDIAKARGCRRTVLFVDEADVRNETQHEFVSLKTFAQQTVMVSATVQDILVEKWNIKGKNIINLSTSSVYRGLRDIIFEPRTLNTDDDVFYALADIAIDDDYKAVNPAHPKVVLVVIDRTIAGMQNIFDRFKRNLFPLDGLTIPARLPIQMSNLCVVLNTGDGIVGYHESFGSDDKKWPRGSSIGDALLWLAQNGGAERFPNIVIIAGFLAARGVNYACYDEKEPANSWHLTHEIISGNQSCASKIQALRICGNHGDNIPLKVYMTQESIDDIRKSEQLTNGLVSCITKEDHPCHRPGMKEQMTNVSCKEIPVRKEDKPANYLARATQKALNIVPNDYEDSTVLDFKRDDREDYSNMRDTLKFTKCEMDKLEMSFREWSTAKTKIGMIMRMIEPTRIYSQREIEDILISCGTRVSNLPFLLDFKVGKAQGYGRIFKKSQGKYTLYEDLRELYSRYFTINK
jgi:hypothetical protein